MKDSDDREGDLFREAMRDVRPLTPVAHPPRSPKPPAEARFTRADRRDVLRESLLPPADAATLATGDELNFRRDHVPEAVLLRLRRGQYTVDAEIDLHGLTGAQAKEALREFIAEATASGLGCVRVIHGKGRRSGHRGPVLKHVVNHWLQRSDSVLAFGSARPVDGGTGAVYVLLQRRHLRAMPRSVRY
ncbi:MAG: DNA mismatch repair protein MutS [Proteobacteria bacterium]|nr:MAG: DNA mismatch repair protein MutS [Pseudomonadota bacterium]